MEQKKFENTNKIVEIQNQSVLSRRIFQKLVEENSENFPEAIEQMTELIRLHYAQH